MENAYLFILKFIIKSICNEFDKVDTIKTNMHVLKIFH